MNYGYRSKADDPIIKNGQFVGCYIGDMILYKDRDPDNQYIFDMGSPFKIVLNGGDVDERMPDKYAKWAIDSSKNGTSLNHVNARCNNNNIAAYTVWVDAVVHVALYAVADIQPGIHYVTSFKIPTKFRLLYTQERHGGSLIIDQVVPIMLVPVHVDKHHFILIIVNLSSNVEMLEAITIIILAQAPLPEPPESTSSTK